MIVRDNKGNELLDIIYVDEDNADMKYEPINHCLAVVKIENDYLMGWNKATRMGNIWWMQGR